MPRNTVIFQILVASPGDVAEERDAVRQAIELWNGSHSKHRGCFLRAVRWETDSSPEMGGPPQEILNRQIVDECDAVIGIFWSRLGTKTSAAVSGTAEEIERMVAAGKPAKLYFGTKNPPHNLDLAQMAALRDFKASLQDKGLLGSFADVAELREKLSHDLTALVNALQTSALPTPALAISFGERDQRKVLGTTLTVTSRIVVEPPEPTADELSLARAQSPYAGLAAAGFLANVLGTYQAPKQERLAYQQRSGLLRPIVLAVRNEGSTMAQHVKVEIEINRVSGLEVVDEAPRKPRALENFVVAPSVGGPHFGTHVEECDQRWIVVATLPDIRPKDVSWTRPFWIGSNTARSVRLDCRALAGNVAEPIETTLEVRVETERVWFREKADD